MEGVSTIVYKGKKILCVNYDCSGGDKEKTLKMIDSVAEEYCKYPPKSALGLGNFSNFRFDKEILNAMKASEDKTAPHQKKTALVGLKPIHKAAYNFLLALTADKFTKSFNTEEEAKEWLVND